MSEKEMQDYFKLKEHYAGWICTGTAIGYTMDQIADFLYYDQHEISLNERDLLKKGDKEGWKKI